MNLNLLSREELEKAAGEQGQFALIQFMHFRSNLAQLQRNSCAVVDWRVKLEREMLQHEYYARKYAEQAAHIALLSQKWSRQRVTNEYVRIGRKAHDYAELNLWPAMSSARNSLARMNGSSFLTLGLAKTSVENAMDELLRIEQHARKLRGELLRDLRTTD